MNNNRDRTTYMIKEDQNDEYKIQTTDPIVNELLNKNQKYNRVLASMTSELWVYLVNYPNLKEAIRELAAITNEDVFETEDINVFVSFTNSRILLNDEAENRKFEKSSKGE